jgi:multidrug resistance efflux pump
LEATIAELSSTITRLNGVVEENQNLKREMELLRIDSSINEQALDQQLRLTEAQRQSAETRCHEISIALDQANLEISTQRDSFHQFQDGLKNQLLSLREALSSDA